MIHGLAACGTNEILQVVEGWQVVTATGVPAEVTGWSKELAMAALDLRVQLIC
jgi:hypothetical protein